jgi:hypothetical protein
MSRQFDYFSTRYFYLKVGFDPYLWTEGRAALHVS